MMRDAQEEDSVTTHKCTAKTQNKKKKQQQIKQKE